MSNMASIPTKKTKGRQKVPLRLIKNLNNRMVTYSKRKSGLFKKASELCTLCGVECGIIVMSPAGKPNSFGHPSIDVIADRYLYGGNLLPHDNQPTQNHMNSNSKLTLLKNRLEQEKKYADALLEARNTMGEEAQIFFKPVDSLNFKEIRQMEESLIVMKSNLATHHTWLTQVHLSQNQNQDPRLNMNPTLSAEQNLTDQSAYYSPTVLGGQNYNLNPNSAPVPNFFSTGPQNLGDPSQMVMMRGPYDNHQMMMIPTPSGFITNPSLGMRPPYDGNYASSNMANLMNASFPNSNMQNPFQGTINQAPIEGQFNGNLNPNMQHPFQGTTNVGQFDGSQNLPTNMGNLPTNMGNLPTNMGMNYAPGNYPSFTSLLMGMDPDVPETSTNPPANP